MDLPHVHGVYLNVLWNRHQIWWREKITKMLLAESSQNVQTYAYITHVFENASISLYDTASKNTSFVPVSQFHNYRHNRSHSLPILCSLCLSQVARAFVLHRHLFQYSNQFAWGEYTFIKRNKKKLIGIFRCTSEIWWFN